MYHAETWTLAVAILATQRAIGYVEKAMIRTIYLNKSI